MYLNDQETAVDMLYYEAAAKTIVRLIRSTPAVPLTIGVHGDWGAGKSSVLKMASSELKQDDKALCIWFNGWTFEGFEDAKTVVIETIVEELRRAKPTSTKVAEAAKKVLKRVDWLKLARKSGGLAFTAMSGIPTPDQFQSLAQGVQALFGKAKEDFSFDKLKELAEDAGDYLKDAEKEGNHIPEHMHKFRKEFEELIAAADVEQLVVIVDDLDRCLPETAIATLEAIRLFLSVPQTAFVVGADEVMIEYAVRKHFPDLPPSMGPVPYARNYLEKLIQVPFRIPALGLAETRIYVTLLLAEVAKGANNSEFKKLLEGARNELKRPWLSRGLDMMSVSQIFSGNVPEKFVEPISISTQITPILTEGTRGNPRQIKRFLNSMSLRYQVAQERGFADDISMPVLAKIMLAESFAPNFYSQIARLAVTAPDGKPAALVQLEKSVSPPPTKERTKAKDADKMDEVDPDVAEWLRSDWTVSWAAIAPPLGNVDLRPYVFATRDKRSYLGGLAAASHLQGIVDRLIGPRMKLAGMDQEITKLSGTEPEQVFDALAVTIQTSEDLSREPKGLHGLLLVVQKHGMLQRRLYEFLVGLPTDKIGAWISNFGTIFTDGPVAAEFNSLVQSWATQSENAKLRGAATGLTKLLKGK
ncbi:NTPase KAP [Duganella sp. FT92W]|uniref:NTPase KAP n=1 Tax=Pseudoduganella rivuli TaxID=2666085 RepID=A0A7X2LSD3_9BURK|nr:Qat anti-phage system ATPase QatA [Pseudoduganella rivuli]MRV70679.1 NTPase KAP [Pseudoduganella rivuli]